MSIAKKLFIVCLGLAGLVIFSVLGITRMIYPDMPYTAHVKLREFIKDNNSNFIDEALEEVPSSGASNQLTSNHGNACDNECERFKQTLSTFPEEKPKAAVYILAGQRYRELNNILQQLYHNFIRRYDYPVIIFHEKDFNRDKLNVTSHDGGCDVYLQEVTFKVPSYVDISKVRDRTDCSYHGVGYRHMCR